MENQYQRLEDGDGLTQEEINEIDRNEFSKTGFTDKVIFGGKYSFQGFMFLFNHKIYLLFLCMFIVLITLSVVCYLFGILAAIVCASSSSLAVVPQNFGHLILPSTIAPPPVVAQISDDDDDNYGPSPAFFVVLVIGILLALVPMLMSICIIPFAYAFIDIYRITSEKTEEIITGKNPDVKCLYCVPCNGECMKFICIFVLTQILENLLFTVLLIPIVIIYYIPVIGWIIGFILMFILSGTSIGFMAFKVVFIRKGDYFATWRFVFSKNNYGYALGVGLGGYIINMIPLIGGMCANFATIIAATRFLCHEKYFKEKIASTLSSPLVEVVNVVQQQQYQGEITQPVLLTDYQQPVVQMQPQMMAPTPQPQIPVGPPQPIVQMQPPVVMQPVLTQEQFIQQQQNNVADVKNV